MNKVDDKGFTLLEVVLNIFLLSFIVFSLSPVISNSVARIEGAYRKNEMTDILNNIFQNHISYRNTGVDREVYGLMMSDLSYSNLDKELADGRRTYRFKWKIYEYNEKLNIYVGELNDEKNCIKWKVYSR